MNDQNRYEEVPQKENKFAKAMKTLGHYFKFVFIDFINSFKYNNMKLAAILFAMPGILLGFFMFAHVPTIRHVTVSYNTEDLNTKMDIAVIDNGTDYYDLSIAKYKLNGTDYDNILMEYVQPTITTENQDDYPVDGEAISGKTRISTPSVSFMQKYTLDDSGNPIYYTDQYDVNFTFEDSSNTGDISKYKIFIFQQASNSKWYLLSSHEFTNPDNVYTISTLGKTGKYKVVAKAIAMKESSTMCSSLLSDEIDIVVYADSPSYVASSTNYIQYSGDYKVKNPSDDNLQKFKMTINADGTAVYNDGASNTSKDGKLSGSGSSLTSVEVYKVQIIPFDFAGISIFFLTLLGFLNVFLSLELSKKKNLGTVVKCCLTTGAILLLSALYIYSIFATQAAMDKKENALVLAGTTSILDNNAYVSIIAVSAACVFSLAGLVLAFINYDRTYEKVDR